MDKKIAPRRATRRRAAVAAAVAFLLLAPASAAWAGNDNPQAQKNGKSRTSATIVNYIADDPLGGENGLPPSPVAPLVDGPINLGLDTDGNAIEAVDEQDIKYFDGYYYMYGQSFSCGAFNYAPGVPYDEVLPTTEPSFYRWCGLVTYRSVDLENWELQSREYPRDEQTGRFVIVKKPRVVFSEATGKYVMWFLNSAGVAGDDPVKYMIGDSPTGPWAPPQSPSLVSGVSNSDLSHDFSTLR